MREIKIISDYNECRELWNNLMPMELVSDLWEVRCCFHEHYRHRLHFVTAEENGSVVGFLPLSWNQETGSYNYFPGETWEGKTWLEQNRIIAANVDVINDMLSALDGPYHLRYLRNENGREHHRQSVDEIGYLFLPADYDYQREKYLQAFSHKTAKKLVKELNNWNRFKVEYRFNEPKDFDILSRMNRSRYGRLSYFHDKRFLKSFRSLMRLLHERGWLRIVTIIVDGKPAAVDMGSLYNGMLTMLAGGTSDKFPGIAKLINMHHINYACEQKLDSVDFLCGDFNWKTMFHLTPVPLYVIDSEYKNDEILTDSIPHQSQLLSVENEYKERPHV